MSVKESLAILLLSTVHFFSMKIPAFMKSIKNMLLQERGATDSINTVNLGLTFNISYFIQKSLKHEVPRRRFYISVCFVSAWQAILLLH